MESERTKGKADVISMVDKAKKMFVRIKLSDNRKYWERWVSFNNKKKWELNGKMKSLDEVLKSQQEIIDKNYKNFYDLVTKK